MIDNPEPDAADPTERADLLQQLSRLEQEITILRIERDLSVALNQMHDLSALWEYLVQTIGQLDVIDSVALYVVEQPAGNLTLVAHMGLSDQLLAQVASFPANSPYIQRVMTGKMIYAQVMQSRQEAVNIYWKEGLQVVAITPMQSREQTVGVLVCGSHSHAMIAQRIRTTIQTIATLSGTTISRIQTEAALQERETSLRHLVQHLPVLLDAFDEHGRILVWNAECERVTGYRADEMVGNPRAMELLYPDPTYRSHMFAQWQRMQGDFRDWEWKLTAKDGSERIIAWSSGTLLGSLLNWDFWCMGVDVTERKQAEAAVRHLNAELEQRIAHSNEQLSESQHLVAQIVETSPGLLYVFDYVQQRNIYTNQAITELLGYTPEEVYALGSNVSSLIHPDDQPQFIELARLLLEGDDDTIVEHEYRMRHAHGEWRWFSGRERVFQRAADGSLLQTLGIALDIMARKQAEEALQKIRLDLEQRVVDRTRELRHANEQLSRELMERIRAEGALRESQHFFQSALDALASYIAILDEHGTIIGVNAAWQDSSETDRWLGANAGVGTNYLDYCAAIREPCTDIARTVALAIRQVLLRQRDEVILEYQRHFPEVTRWFHLRVTRFISDGTLRVVMAHENITARKQMEEALRQSEQRFATVFHASPVAICISRLADGLTHEVNESFLDLLGYRRSEVIGHTTTALRLWLSPTQHASLVQQLSEWRTIREIELTCRTRTGETREVLASFELIHVNDEECMLTLFQDITARKQERDALQEANQQLSAWIVALEQRTREISTLNELGSLLQTCYSIPEACAVVARVGPQLFPSTSGAIYVCDAERAFVHAVAGWLAEQAPDWTATFPLSSCWGLRRGRTHRVTNTQTEVVCQHLSLPLPAASVCVPLFAQGEVAGLLYLSSPTAGNLDEAQEQVAIALAEQIALTMTNLTLRERLHEQSIRDPLTGLFNRRYLLETLERELREATRHQRQMGIIMLDIDHFKDFNTTYGHEGGDMLLRAIASFVQSHIRGEDIACRYGGEEFILVLLDASTDDSWQRAEQVRLGIQHLRVQHQGKQLGAISCSLGVATFPEHGTTVEHLIDMADKALYRAKELGRNQVVIATS